MEHLTFYISGPMTGLPEFNFPAFVSATMVLRAKGHAVLSPHETEGGPSTTSWEEFMRRDLIMMLTSCNAMVLLPGWELSRGAQLELSAAHALSWPLYSLSDGQLQPYELRVTHDA